MNRTRSGSSSKNSSSSVNSGSSVVQTSPDVETGNDGSIPDDGALPVTRNPTRVSFQTPPATSRTSSISFVGHYSHPRRIQQQRETVDAMVSPSETFDTALTSPSSTRSFTSEYNNNNKNAASSSPPQKLIIDHNIKSVSDNDTATTSINKPKQQPTRGHSSRAVTTLLFGLSKPLMGIGILILLGASAMAAWGWLFQIPGLENQVKALEEQVLRLNTEIDRLTGQIDRLKDENDRYQDLNDQLNSTVVELEDVKDDLHNVAVDLNTTNQELADKVDELENQNAAYETLNKELNETVGELAAEVQYFKAALADLAYENAILSNMTDALEALTEQFTNTSVSQNETLVALQQFLQDLMEQNDRLEEFNSNLVALVNFLNETSTGLGSSLEDITTYLTNQIEINQQLVLLSVENTYRQRVQSWDCDYRDVFRGEPFGDDYTVPINTQTTAQLPTVLDYVDTRVLSKLCLDVENFSTFLQAEYPDGQVTSNRLIRAVTLYSESAMEYLFSATAQVNDGNVTAPAISQIDDGNGIPLQEWVEASFQCTGLKNTYVWVASPQR